MPTVNETYWGKPFTFYGTFNLRTGASDLSDSDYTDFPPFVLNDFRYEQSVSPDYSRATLRQAQNENSPQHTYWTPNNPYPDLSIAYCGIKNKNLPQCNVRGYGTFPQSAAYDYSNMEDNYCFRTIPDDIKPVMFVSNYRYQMYRADYSTYSNLPVNEFYNPYSGTSPNYTNGRFLWSPNTRDEPNNHPQRNTTYDTAYYRSIGLRTIFGVIMVQYYDVTTELHNTRKIPTTTHVKSMIDYESQTTAWKETKKIVRVYLDLYYRTSTTGLYERVDGKTTIKDSIVVDSIYGLKANTDIVTGLSEDDVSIYAPCFAYTNGTTNGNLPLFGLRSSTNTGYSQVGTNANGGMSSGNYVIIYGADMGTFKHGVSGASYERMVWREIDGDADLDFFRNAAAGYGLFFTDGVASDSGYADLFAAGHDTDRWYSDKMCLGVVDSRGYTDGTYTRGLLNATAPNWSWKTTDQSPYDPSLPPVPENHYSTQTEFNSIGDLASLTKRYVLNATGVESLGAALWDITADLIDNGGTPDYSELNEKILDQFLTNNPIDCIVGLQRYPMTIPTVGTDTVKLGKTDTGISCKPMEKTAFYYLFTGNTIAPKFGDSFLDYEPYTKMELYVPFCGTIQLNPADILNRKLNVQLAVDFTTGTATGFIMSDDLVIETVNGNIAIDLPITGIQAATVASQLNNAIANKMNRSLTRETATLGRISVQGLLRTISNPLAAHNEGEIAKNEETRADYELTHQNAPVHIIGSASAVGGWCIDLKCRLLIYYPTGEILRNANPPEWDNIQLARYGKNTGFACCMEKSIGSMNSGLVLGINPDLSGMVTNSTAANPATAAELELIRSAIAEGVIVPLLE